MFLQLKCLWLPNYVESKRLRTCGISAGFLTDGFIKSAATIKSYKDTRNCFFVLHIEWCFSTLSTHWQSKIHHQYLAAYYIMKWEQLNFVVATYDRFWIPFSFTSANSDTLILRLPSFLLISQKYTWIYFS